MNNDLVSVAMTTYNGEHYLEKQLESIINQSFKNIEIIIVDDCSSDKTKQILQSFHDEYSDIYNIKILDNLNNIGFVKNFEKAIRHCSGKYIALCDQDDVWHKNKIELLVGAIDNYSLIFSDVSLMDSKGDIYVKSRSHKFKIDNKSNISFRELVFKNYVIGCSCLFSSAIINDILPFPEDALFHDWWIAIVAVKRQGIKYYDESLIDYRQHDSNVYGQRSIGFLKKVMALVFRNESRVNEYNKRIKRIESMKGDPIFSIEDGELMNQALLFYSVYVAGGVVNLACYWFYVVKHYSLISTKRTFLRSFIVQLTSLKKLIKNG